MIPTNIGRYEVKRELGRGGMATVYLAYDPSFDREVALKLLPKEFLHDPNFNARFQREIKVIAALEHPSIVPVYDLGQYDGAPYYVMRYMPGGSLSQRIAQGEFDLREAARITQKLASAMAYAHRKGIVHRDLKPDNILFDSDDMPYISDFGVASIATSSGSLTGDAAIGTPAYMSPEQAQGDKADNRADIYSLGVIVYEMLTGTQPYKADTPMAVALKHITERVPEILAFKPDLPHEIDIMIKTAMAKNKENRYATVIDMAKAFSDAAQVPFQYEPYTKPLDPADAALMALRVKEKDKEKEKPAPKKGIPLAAIIAAVALLVVAGGAILFAGKPAEPTPPPPTNTQPPVFTPTDEVTPTITSIPQFFTEEFNDAAGFGAFWKPVLTDGVEENLKMSIENGVMKLGLDGGNMRYYAYYEPTTYSRVRLDARVKSLDGSGTINHALFICWYNEGKGWYEFRVSNGGLYEINYVSFNTDQIHTSSVRLANGGSLEVKTGREVNDYSVVCDSYTLSLFANGTLIKTLEERRFQLEDGYVGFGAMSDKNPMQMEFDSVSISQP